MPTDLTLGLGVADVRSGSGIIVSDTFTRADSAASLGTSDSGHAWTAHRGTWGIQTNRGYLATSSGSNDCASVNASVANATVSCVVVAIGAGGSSDWRLVANVTDADNYFVLVAGVGSNYTLYRVQAGGFTSIGTVAVVPAANDIASIQRQGSTITARVNGTSSGAITDTFNQSATRFGLASGGSVSAARYDSFLVTVP